MSRPTTADAVRRTRVAAQLLSGPGARSAEGVAGQLLAVQAQNLRAARLAVRARSRGLTVASVNHELGADRAVVISWLCRGTLHLVRRDDLAWLHGLTAPTQLVANRRRLEQEGVSDAMADRGVRLIERMLADDGPTLRASLAERLTAKGIVTSGQAMVHLLFLAVSLGIVVRGPFQGAEQAWVLTDDWLGERPPASLAGDRRAAALAELARRYLRGHGPASVADLALWAGLPQRDARAGLDAIAGELRESGGRVDLASRRAVRRAPPPRLLPAFDAYLVGWSDRTFAVAPEHVRQVRVGGLINPVATVQGMAVGTWAAPRTGSRVDVRLELWDDLEAPARVALAAEAEDVARFEAAR